MAMRVRNPSRSILTALAQACGRCWKPRKGLYFVAEIDGVVAGQMMITFEWSDWRNGDIWWIQSVYVPAEHRRKGVFKSLYEHVRAEARRRGVVGLRLYVERENQAAQQTYIAMGMHLSHYLLMEETLKPG